LNAIPILGSFIEKKVMPRDISILLGKHFEKFILEEVTSGRYNSASEVIISALRLLEAEEMKKKNINQVLAEGEKSGFEKDFDPIDHLKKLHSKFL